MKVGWSLSQFNQYNSNGYQCSLYALACGLCQKILCHISNLFIHEVVTFNKSIGILLPGIVFTDDEHTARKKMGGGVTNHADTLHVTFFASFSDCIVPIINASYYFSVNTSQEQK